MTGNTSSFLEWRYAHEFVIFYYSEIPNSCFYNISLNKLLFCMMLLTDLQSMQSCKPSQTSMMELFGKNS